MPGSPKPDNAMPGAGKSEADAARPVRLEERPDAGPGAAADREGSDLPDAGDEVEKHRSKTGGDIPGAVRPDALTTENDDGVS